MGRLHHAIATKNCRRAEVLRSGADARLRLQSRRGDPSFRRAAELDPASPMPHWGIALALGPNINLDVDPEREAAYDEAQRAKRLPRRRRPTSAPTSTRLSSATRTTRRRTEALAVDYKDAMSALVRRIPNDLDAATLYAESLMDLHPWQLWSADGTPTEGTEEIVSVLESVLTRDAMHVGANHYYIHAVEASKTPDRALPSARRLDTLVPAAGHLVHMPAHIYMRTGNYQGASRQREGRRRRSPVHRIHGRRRRLSADVLQPQPGFPRFGRR
jgi:hypothetical protein